MRYLLMLLMMLMLCGLAFSDVEYQGQPLFTFERSGFYGSPATLEINDVDERAAAVFIAKSAQNVTKIVCKFGTVTGGTDVKVDAILCAVNTANGEPDEGTVYGTSGDTLPVAGWQELSLSTPYQVTAGTPYAVVIKNTSTDPSTDYFVVSVYCSNFGAKAIPYSLQANTSGTWSKDNTTAPMVFPVYADGSIPTGCCSGTAGYSNIGNDSTPDEYAQTFTVDTNTICTGAKIWTYINTGCDWQVTLIEDTTDIYTVAVDGDIRNVTSYSAIEIDWAAYTLHSGHTYHLSLKPTVAAATGTLRNSWISYPSSAYKALNWGTTGAYMSSRVNGGAWTDYNSSTDWSILLASPLVTTKTITSGAIMGGPNGGFDQ